MSDGTCGAPFACRAMRARHSSANTKAVSRTMLKLMVVQNGFLLCSSRTKAEWRGKRNGGKLGTVGCASRLGKAGFRLPFPWRSGDTHAARYFSLLLEKPPLSHITHVTRAGAQRGRDAVRSRPPVHHGAASSGQSSSQSAVCLVSGCSGPSAAVLMASARSNSGLASACLACS